MSIATVMRLLAEEYGAVNQRPYLDPVSELVMTILSQNTSDHNSRRAYDRLLAEFGSLEAVAGADVEDIARAIKMGGLAQVKAPRIKTILEHIASERGALDLGFLRDTPVEEARSWLLSLPGVGPKTAACVLLFSLGRPVLPVDTHVHRVAKRLGLIDSRVTAERAHEVLGAKVPPQGVYQFHIHMIEHGRRVCKSQRPRCESCALLQVCPSGRAALGAAPENEAKA